MQGLLSLLFPPQCSLCDALTAEDFALCPECWRDTPFIHGLVCDACGAPLLGEDEGRAELCDECLAHPRPWTRGRAAMLYRDNGRKLVLALKHGDRTELARTAAPWLLRAARPLIGERTLVAPVPLHRGRLFRRRYNQSALLSARLARLARCEHCPDLLVRRRRTPSQEGRSREARFANLAGAIEAHPRRAGRMRGRDVLLVDDVMTSGATLAAAAGACLAAGAAEVKVVVLSRVAMDD